MSDIYIHWLLINLRGRASWCIIFGHLKNRLGTYLNSIGSLIACRNDDKLCHLNKVLVAYLDSSCLNGTGRRKFNYLLHVREEICPYLKEFIPFLNDFISWHFAFILAKMNLIQILWTNILRNISSISQWTYSKISKRSFSTLYAQCCAVSAFTHNSMNII